jgi:hypothetical protein
MRRVTILKVVAAVGIAVLPFSGLMGSGIGVAHADSDDAAFLAAMADDGLTALHGEDYTLINTAHNVCLDLSTGITVPDEARRIGRWSTSNGGFLPLADSLYFVGAAEGAYCPWLIGHALEPIGPPSNGSTV